MSIGKSDPDPRPLNKIEKSTLREINKKWSRWIKSSNVQIHNIKKDHAGRVFEKYFEGIRPFSQIKNRSDIPDAFINEVIVDLYQAKGNLHVICNDKNLRECVSQNSEIFTYDSLDAFIKSKICRDLLLEKKVLTHLEDIILNLKKNKKALQKVIKKEYIEVLAGRSFEDSYIPEDNNEATIQSLDDIDELDILFDDVIYYGDGTLGIPFSLTTEAECYYCIFKHDYYGLPASRQDSLSIEDWNDHYYIADETFKIEVEGLITVTLDLINIRKDGPVAKYVRYDSAKIDEIAVISIINCFEDSICD